jgi:hypothetical protein
MLLEPSSMAYAACEFPYLSADVGWLDRLLKTDAGSRICPFDSSSKGGACTRRKDCKDCDVRGLNKPVE